MEEKGQVGNTDLPIPKVRILDLCSSWISHLPEGKGDELADKIEVVGVGLNEKELERNKRLKFYQVRLRWTCWERYLNFALCAPT